MIKKLTSVAALALAFSAGSAFAADLPSHKSPPAAYAPMFAWTGFYAGVNIGYGFGNGDPSTGYQSFSGLQFGPVLLAFPGGAVWNAPTNLEGVIGGGQIGANFQFSPWLVLGVEADFQGAGLASNATAAAPYNRFGFIPAVGIANINSRVDWWGTLRGRVGVTPFSPNIMLYGSAGLAYGGVNNRFTFSSLSAIGPASAFATGSSTYSDVNFGWTAGGGAEWAPLDFPNWSVKVEYLYTDLGSSTLSTLGTGNFTFFGFPVASFVNSATNTTHHRWHTVRAGLNYRFNFSAPPVMGSF